MCTKDLDSDAQIMRSMISGCASCRLGNMIRMQLHEDSKGVIFAGYRIPHPLESKMVIMVKVRITLSIEYMVTHSHPDL